MVTFMLVLNIIILLGMIAFETGRQFIFAFFFLIYFANYINFLGFNYMVRHLKTPEGPQLKKNTNPYFIVMNILYLFVFAMGFTARFGPFCEKGGKLYPPCLNFAAYLFVINATYHCYLHYRGYYLKWEADEKVQAIVGREHEFGFEPISVMKPVFEK